MSAVAKEPHELRAETREDFMKRLFAVAISVGFGFAVTRMEWVQKATVPQAPERGQIAIVLTALFATVLSWDGYLLSIRGKPLYSTWRFGIDIFLVFTYMFLLMTSMHGMFWLPILSVIFLLYVLWDVLTIREHYDKYYLVPGTPKKAHIEDIVGVYWGGVAGGPQISRGPIITIIWCAYFVGLTLIARHYPDYNVYAACVLAITGLLLYRSDKQRKNSHYDRGYKMPFRLSAIILLLLLAAAMPRLIEELSRICPS